MCGTVSILCNLEISDDVTVTPTRRDSITTVWPPFWTLQRVTKRNLKEWWPLVSLTDELSRYSWHLRSGIHKNNIGPFDLYLEISDNVTPPGAIQSQSIWPPFCLTEVLFRYSKELRKGTPKSNIGLLSPLILLLKFLTGKSTAAAGFCAL